MTYDRLAFSTAYVWQTLSISIDPYTCSIGYFTEVMKAILELKSLSQLDLRQTSPSSPPAFLNRKHPQRLDLAYV